MHFLLYQQYAMMSCMHCMHWTVWTVCEFVGKFRDGIALSCVHAFYSHCCEELCGERNMLFTLLSGPQDCILGEGVLDKTSTAFVNYV